jgi:hypothetical protein
MFSVKWILPIVCAGTALAAQSSNDLNGLATAASRYVSSGMAGSHDPQPLELCRIVGNYEANNSPVLMTRATDVQHWIFFYRLGGGAPQEADAPDAAAADPTADPEPAAEPETGAAGIVLPRHKAVLAECSRGVFNNFRYSAKAVKAMKSLEHTWVAVSLDTAIQNLNANGYVRGFSSVGLVRPDSPRFPKEFVYVFNCPWDRTKVAISCQTGALTWTEQY